MKGVIDEQHDHHCSPTHRPTVPRRPDLAHVLRRGRPRGRADLRPRGVRAAPHHLRRPDSGQGDRTARTAVARRLHHSPPRGTRRRPRGTGHRVLAGTGRPGDGGRPMSLERVMAAESARRAAEIELREAVKAAVEDGESIADVAAAAEVTRQTVYRWLGDESLEHPTRKPMRAMEAGLQVLLELGVGPSHELMAAIRTKDPVARARRVLLLIRDVSKYYSAEQAVVLRAAAHVASLVMRRADAQG